MAAVNIFFVFPSKAARGQSCELIFVLGDVVWVIFKKNQVGIMRWFPMFCHIYRLRRKLHSGDSFRKIILMQLKARNIVESFLPAPNFQ